MKKLLTKLFKKKKTYDVIEMYEKLGFHVEFENGKYYIYTKDFGITDRVYWLGPETKNLKKGTKLLVTTKILYVKDRLPFYKLIDVTRKRFVKRRQPKHKNILWKYLS